MAVDCSTIGQFSNQTYTYLKVSIISPKTHSWTYFLISKTNKDTFTIWRIGLLLKGDETYCI